MTRINCVPVQELCNKHLFAEWREMPRLVKNLEQSLNRKSKPFNMCEIPLEYKMGSGHVKFFYNKFKYLDKRHKELTTELLKRGYNVSEYNPLHFASVSEEFYGDWIPSEYDKNINRQRIQNRLPLNPRYDVVKNKENE